MDTLPDLLKELIDQSNLLYIVAVTAALVWLLQPIYKGIYSLLTEVAADKDVQARLEATRRSLLDGSLAHWLGTNVSSASGAIQKGFDKLYGAVQSVPANSALTAIGRTRPYLTPHSLLISVCVAMAYSLAFMLYQQYPLLTATNAWRWALTAVFWLMLVPIYAQIKYEYPNHPHKGKRVHIFVIMFLFCVGFSLNVKLASTASIGLWIAALIGAVAWISAGAVLVKRNLTWVGSWVGDFAWLVFTPPLATALAFAGNWLESLIFFREQLLFGLGFLLLLGFGWQSMPLCYPG